MLTDIASWICAFIVAPVDSKKTNQEYFEIIHSEIFGNNTYGTHLCITTIQQQAAGPIL